MSDNNPIAEPLLSAISERLRTQDNRITQNPMFCVQIKVREIGYDANYADGDTVWIDMASGDFEEVEFGQPGAEEFGYKDRWETVMVAFTEKGCEEYLELNGHNDRRKAHNGEVRIYVESFNRCPEMIAIREALMSGTMTTPATQACACVHHDAYECARIRDSRDMSDYDDDDEPRKRACACFCHNEYENRNEED